jgi:hypothetical protein
MRGYLHPANEGAEGTASLSCTGGIAGYIYFMQEYTIHYLTKAGE